MLTYANGFGWNVYYRGICAGRSFNGERFFAIDWHEEKVPERGPDGLWIPRSQMRTVCRPHVHMCWRRLDFWPWSWEPPMPDELELQELRKQRELTKQRRSAKKEAAAAPKVLAKVILDAALQEVMAQLGGELTLLSLFEAGSSLDTAAADFAGAVEKKLIESGAIQHVEQSKSWRTEVAADVRKACKRVVGGLFARVQKTKKQNAKALSGPAPHTSK